MNSIKKSLLALSMVAGVASSAHADSYYQTNITSNVAGLANNFDANLRNPWGIANSATGPFWVSNQGSGNSTLYNASGVPQPLVVTVPATSSAPEKGPTGQVFNPTTDFTLTTGGKSVFLFADLSGQVSGWNGAQGTLAQTVINKSSTGAVYSGIALGNTGGNNFLYVANNAANTIEVYDKNFASASLSGNFTDASLSSDLTVHNIQAFGNKLYVAYQSKTNAGGGAVDVFNMDGTLSSSLIANGPGGKLDSPWGLTIAPSTFGKYANALLVGNENQGTINAFNVSTGAFIDTMSTFEGKPFINLGLWGLTFRSAAGYNPNSLYLTAGLAGEVNGLFATITAVPEPSSFLLMGLGASVVLVVSRRNRRV